jgi:hypothetical protein
MSMSPQDVAVLIQREGSGASLETYDAANEPEGAVLKRTKLLSSVLETLKQQDPPSLEATAKALGDGSRDGKCEITPHL